MTRTTTPTGTPAGPPELEVVGLRVHTHGEVTPAWVRDTVLPVWDEVRDGGRRLVRLRRGWLGGPHVDVVAVGPTPDRDVWAALARSLDAGPPPATPLDPEEYLDRARVRGRLERVDPPYLPLREHGTTLLLDRAAAEATGPTAALRGLADAVLAPALVGNLREVAERPDRLPATLLDVLTVVADAHVLGAGFGTFSLRSHAEALLASWSPRGDLRPELHARYEQQRGPIVERVAELLGGDGGGGVTAWRTAVAYTRGVLDESVRRGDLTNAAVDAAADPDAAARPATTTDHPDTDFHRAVHGSGATDGAGEWFAAYRVLVNCVYGQLPLLGVSPLHRAWGCWAVAHAVDEVLGETWTDRLAAAAPRPRQEATR
ncbi:hypothetical protein KC207_04380 [Phycicoccus sp. BSK3Z-2]|uniref:Thiopeptide-type bacteriocin biosynthesis domain-containing protein n=1 Tax=Phycicoccus avicenniae TaxID=2828860 RepID=A0A941D5K0_9MICO|nr:hypothetical protein [Phycicoccus avicenniae]MBR7742524.1 hypothetical protein [Phycicoccus avicenniae]